MVAVMVAVSSVVVTFVIAVMVLMIPVAFVEFPTLLIAVVVRMNPISTRIGWTFPVSRNPAVVVVADRDPVSPRPSCIPARRNGSGADLQFSPLYRKAQV